MGFIMEGLDAEAYDRTYTDRQLIKRIISYFRPKVGLMLVITILVVLGSCLDTAFPLLIAQSLDALVGTQVLHTALLLVGLILVSAALSWTCNMFRQHFTAIAVGDVVLKLRTDTFASVMERDMSFFDEFSSGKIISRVTSDTDSFATVVTLILNLLSQVLLFLLIAAVLFFRNAHLALLSMTIMPVIILIALGFRSLARRLTRQAQRSLARVNSNVQEVISGITIAKNFRQEQNMFDAFQDINKQSYYVNVRSGFLYNGIFPILVMIANAGTTIVIYFGGLDVLGHTISAGEWFLFVQSIGLLWLPLTSIASFWSQFQLGLAASERVFALLDAEPRIQQTAQHPPTRIEGTIDFQNLFFSYDDKQTVLKNFNLHIKAGETIAFVGHTGAGKSSIGKLIARFYEFQGGQLSIDGQDIRTFDLHAYRRQLGIVPQFPFLFSGTVTDNIRYARPDATDMEIETVARHIGGGDWLDALPEGLQTPVGETGKALSMGQRQIVALARVLLQDPAIIIMDEATASIDPLTEAQIQEGLDVILKDRTAIVIAHRLSTIRHADRIIVIDRGNILEEGRHETLMQQRSHYAELYNTYFRHQSPDYKPGEGFIEMTQLPVEDPLQA
ncbi:MAG TPA: ABC transporter ATP-binding protein [Dictyobacter sp.]|jgi:ABC-type multidrug transport system fused ATPase/permease subunit|nr:ABC transporter ATP-binding protein [Dictyobacter sp.]